MALSFLIGVLGKEIGLPLARKLVSGLVSGQDPASRVEKITALVKNGSTAMAAFQNTFGVVDFDKALTTAIGNGAKGWTYEAGREEYVQIEQIEGSPRLPTSLLREELNLNLDRIIRTRGSKDADINNYFIGLFRQWQERYVELIGDSEDSRITFKTVESLLDGRKKSFADVFRMLQKTGLGMAGAALVIQAALIATSTGVGIMVWITTAFVGIPMVQVGALAVAGGLLFGLSRMDFASSNAKSATIAVAYKLLDRCSNTKLR
ncbi:hypothetical protein [Polaromonas glacialis]|uniref:hypothetical protein n=1 Tax=Polaromonas glacialis TaxID=866564 RepID=UPI000497E8D0|nr:hypothetical protein [Polaromonas glacialis]